MTAPTRPRLGALVLVLVLTAAATVPALAVDHEYQSLMRNAQRYMTRGHHDLAAKLYERLLQKHPTDLRASIGMADALIATDQLDRADEFLESAMKQVPETPEKADLIRARVRLRRAQDRLDDAFEDVVLILGKNAERATWADREAQDLIHAGLNGDRARTLATDARKKHPGELRFRVLESVVITVDGDPEEALDRMVDYDREHDRQGEAVLTYATELEGLGRDALALEGMTVAVERTEKPAARSRIRFDIAGIQERQGLYRDALASLEVIVAEREGTSTASKALLRSAEIHQKYLDDPEGALAVYEKLKDDPVVGHHRPDMLLQMGDCYLRLGRFDAASTTYAEVLPAALDPEQAERASLRIADVEFYRGNPDSAHVYYQSMAEANARSLFADDAADRYILLNRYMMAGQIELLQVFGRLEWARMVGDSAGVAENSREIIGVDAQGELEAEALLALADMAEAAGNRPAARGYLRSVAEDHPGDAQRAPRALMRLGKLLEEDDRPQEALMHYETVLVDYSTSVHAGEARRQVETLRRDLKS